MASELFNMIMTGFKEIAEYRGDYDLAKDIEKDRLSLNESLIEGLEEDFYEMPTDEDEPVYNCPDCGDELTFVGYQGNTIEYKCPICGKYFYDDNGELLSADEYDDKYYEAEDESLKEAFEYMLDPGFEDFLISKGIDPDDTDDMSDEELDKLGAEFNSIKKDKPSFYDYMSDQFGDDTRWEENPDVEDYYRKEYENKYGESLTEASDPTSPSSAKYYYQVEDGEIYKYGYSNRAKNFSSSQNIGKITSPNEITIYGSKKYMGYLEDSLKNSNIYGLPGNIDDYTIKYEYDESLTEARTNPLKEILQRLRDDLKAHQGEDMFDFEMELPEKYRDKVSDIMRDAEGIRDYSIQEVKEFTDNNGNPYVYVYMHIYPGVNESLTEASDNSIITAGWDEELQAAIVPKWLYDEWE